MRAAIIADCNGIFCDVHICQTGITMRQACQFINRNLVSFSPSLPYESATGDRD